MQENCCASEPETLRLLVLPGPSVAIAEMFLRRCHYCWIALRICFALWLGTQPVHAAALSTAEFDIPYQLRLLDKGRVLEISGSFSWALPQTFQAILASAPAVRVIRLESPGGHIQPALEVAKIIHERDLNTFVGRFCASACTIAFLAGQQRWLGPQGHLGFHQAHAPGLPPELANGYLHEAYRQLGMPAVFITRVLRTPPDDIWLPAYSELKAARLITDFSSETPSIAGDDWSRSLRDIAQGAQTASDDTISQLASELCELLLRMQNASPENCWIFAHEGLADLRAYAPQALLDAMITTQRRMAEEATRSSRPPLSSQDRLSVVERLTLLMRNDGHGAVLEGLRTGADHSLFCPSLRDLLNIALQLPAAERTLALRAILPRS